MLHSRLPMSASAQRSESDRCSLAGRRARKIRFSARGTRSAGAVPDSPARGIRQQTSPMIAVHGTVHHRRFRFTGPFEFLDTAATLWMLMKTCIRELHCKSAVTQRKHWRSQRRNAGLGQGLSYQPLAVSSDLQAVNDIDFTILLRRTLCALQPARERQHCPAYLHGSHRHRCASQDAEIATDMERYRFSSWQHEGGFAVTLFQITIGDHSPSGRRHGRSRPQNDVSSELIGVKQADALPNALGAFG
jgi:hypothetical protein